MRVKPGESDDQSPPPKRGRGRPRHTEPSKHFLKQRQAILEAAKDAFRERGYAEGSLTDIANATGVRKASLYYYFPSKSHLLYHLFDEEIDRSLEKIQTIVQNVPDPVDRLRAMIRHQVMLVIEDPDLFRTFFDDRPTLDDEITHTLRRKERSYLRFFMIAVKDVIDTGKLPTINSHTGANAIIGMIFWMYKWYVPGQRAPDKIVQDFERLILGS